MHRTHRLFAFTSHTYPKYGKSPHNENYYADDKHHSTIRIIAFVQFAIQQSALCSYLPLIHVDSNPSYRSLSWDHLNPTLDSLIYDFRLLFVPSSRCLILHSTIFQSPTLEAWFFYPLYLRCDLLRDSIVKCDQSVGLRSYLLGFIETADSMYDYYLNSLMRLLSVKSHHMQYLINSKWCMSWVRSKVRVRG